ncbi:MAG: magnesium transporter [Tenericutes bacterium]|nr:magnesium transporter [Mycoplasmatota bacterium]
MSDIDQLEEYIEKIIDILISEKDIATKRELIDEYHDYEIAKAMEEMSQETREILYKVLPEKLLADVFEELEPESAFEILENTNLKVIAKIFKEMQVDDLVDIVNFSDDEEDRITYLSLIEVDKRLVVTKLIEFEDDVVGSIMNNSYIEVYKDDTVKQAIKKVVLAAPDTEYINNIYVTENDILIGALSLKELLNAGNSPTTLVEDLMSENLIYVRVSSKNEDALVLMQNYDFQLLPVVDKYKKLIGIISFDDMIDTLKEESEQDYSSLAGISDVAVDENETVLETIKKRLPWLIFLLFISLITSGIISSYENALLILPTLSIFMPLVLNMAGNSGTQSLGIVIRLFAKNELSDKKSIFKHLLNEFLTGVVNGLLIAIAVFIMVMFFNLVRGTNPKEGLRFAIVIALSINVSLIVSTVAGTIIPLIINSFKLDPAVASGPFITTINDILSLLIYFGLATILIISNF